MCKSDVAIFAPLRYTKDERSTERMRFLMRIAVTYENGQVFPHFGRSPQFKLYDITDGKVIASQVVDTNSHGHSALVGLLTALHVDAVICGGLGAPAQAALAQAGIRLYGGVSGEADNAVNALLAGTLAFDPAPPSSCCHGSGPTCS